MMRPMKLAGSQLLFGQGCLEHVKTLNYKRAIVVTGGSSMKKSGMLDRVNSYLSHAGMALDLIDNVEPDPTFKTIYKGALQMRGFKPDLIVALGGGSAMDAAKAMWIYYEHEDLNALGDILAPKKIPPLRKRAHMLCIPSTSGTASEVSRSIVVTDENTGIKYGIGDMELMPDIAICDPEVTISMPPHISAQTGLDAMTHALEALVSNRANYISDIFAIWAIKDIFNYLPKAYTDGGNIEYREYMLNASLIAGMAFTNVSLGITHSMAHTMGSYFGLSHGLADAILLPHVIAFNYKDELAKNKYDMVAKELGGGNMADLIAQLNQKVGIPSRLSAVVKDKETFMKKIDEMAEMALKDGCTKTNPVIPSLDEFKELFLRSF